MCLCRSLRLQTMIGLGTRPLCSCRRHWPVAPRSERKPGTQLKFPPRRGRFRNGAELRRVHKPIWSPIVRVIQRVEAFSAHLQVHPLANGESANQRQIHGLQAGAIHGVAADIAERECGGRRKSRGIKPGICRLRAGTEDRLPRVVRANRILAKNGSGIRRVAEYRDGEGETALGRNPCPLCRFPSFRLDRLHCAGRHRQDFTTNVQS
jgi:hypothetical protein